MEIIIKAMIAALLTLGLERVPKFLETWKIKREHFSLLGDNWKCFHYSFRHGKPELIKSTWSITSGWLTPFKVNSKQQHLIYKGYLILEGEDRVIFCGKSTTQNERVVFRFPNPLRSASDIIFGLWLSYDHDKHISSGGALLTKEDITDEQAEQKIKGHIMTYINHGFPLLRVND